MGQGQCGARPHLNAAPQPDGAGRGRARLSRTCGRRASRAEPHRRRGSEARRGAPDDDVGRAICRSARDAEEALAGDGTSVPRLNAALRKLERRRETAGGRLDHVCQSLDRVLAEVGEAERAIAEAQRAFVFDPKELEKSEERLFALRAAARKFKCTVDTLAEVRERFEAELAGAERRRRPTEDARAGVQGSRAMPMMPPPRSSPTSAGGRRRRRSTRR